MPSLHSLLTPGRTRCRAPVVSKKKLFETVATLISEDQPDLAYEDVFSHLIAREKLGSTALGRGIAIPHCRLDSCPQPLGALLTLKDAIDFEATDKQAVDLVFVLLVPGEAHQQHLDILANIASVFSQERNCQQMRDAHSDEDLFAIVETLTP